MWADLDIEDTISKLTFDEKIGLLSGIDFWHTKPVPRLGIPSLRTTDGPNGVRGTRFFNGVPAACLPCGTALAATWDAEIIRRGGVLQGDEVKAKGAHVLLGPTVNIQRSPLGGRGFESFSEDPLLSGVMAAATIQGVQSTGVAAAIKHFVCNDQEHERVKVDARVTERALREIYLMPFMIAQRDANPMSYMTAYNSVNGLHCSENPKLLTSTLRGEWGFDGLVMSDWFGTYSAFGSINAGLDLEMPGPSKVRGDQAKFEVSVGKLSTHIIDERVRKLLQLVNRVMKSGVPENAEEKAVDTPETAKLLREIGNSGLVLLKNENDVLPFKKEKTVAVIGPNANFAAFSGGGSASLLPYYAVTPLQGITSQASTVKYALGAIGYKKLPLLTDTALDLYGKPGLTARFYATPPTEASRKLLDEVHVGKADVLLADYNNPALKDQFPLFYMDLEGTLTPKADGIYDFSLSVCGTGKLYIEGNLVIDNATKQRAGDSFFGSGTAEETGHVELKAGQEYKILVHFGSSPTQTLSSSATTIVSGGGIRLGGTIRTDPAEEIEKAVALAKSVDQVVVCAGLNSDWESEGYDRETMDLPLHMNALIEAVVAANPRAAVVLQSGTPVSMPWISRAPAVIQAWYGGNETGNAIADVLFGSVNPSGKLPLTFPVRNEDNPAFLHYRSERGRTLYGEDVYVGYRFYEKVRRAPLFPFGHGLSYTTFRLWHVEVSQVEDKGKETINVAVNIKNTGSRAGAQVVQVYVSPRSSSINRPSKELKGFTKVLLQPDETQRVEIKIEKKYAASFWDEETDSWIMEAGTYDVLVGESSASTPIKGSFEVKRTVWWSGL